MLDCKIDTSNWPTARNRTLYVCDLDGTLLNSSSQISDFTATTLNALMAKGLWFTVATARTPATVEPLLSELHTNIPYIVMAGAAIWSHATQEYVYTNPLRADIVDKICSVCLKNGIRPFIYRRHGNKLGVHHFGDMSKQEEVFVEERMHLELKKFYLDDANYATGDDEALLVLSINDFERLEYVYREVAKNVPCSSVCYHDIFDPSSAIFETYAEGSSKAHAIKILARKIGSERIVVFGDNLNDLPMLEVADYSVSPSNAVDELKDKVDEVIGSNDEDSVAKWIEADFAINSQDK